MTAKSDMSTLDDLTGDLAGRYRWTPSAGASVESDLVDADLAALARDGFVIWENLLSDNECRKIRDALAPMLSYHGRNSFEGHRTQRLYSVLSKTRACDRLVDHPRPLAVLDRLLMPNYLLSALQVINIEPGESSQLLHFDDAFYPIPRPRPALGAATIWAIDDFTAANGATVVIPASHRWDDRRPTPTDIRKSVIMPAGSCIFFLGTLWHGGGANNTEAARLAVTAQYCQPWLRPLEAFTLSVPTDIAKVVSADIQRMLGYSIHPPFVGAVDGQHPLRLLEQPAGAQRQSLISPPAKTPNSTPHRGN
ncbi:phytanoyl-CoA dioxygenase [Mycobacterium persicum]|uniref:Phytanoyl-CoA dioxygenase n=1 Tax=Mycobacterium persicum TaxID=1487726 RepID=A0A8E2ITU3_9MYCO|nr:phytanoyl-CoA dioxygenase [Mycobacterium persicum]ORB95189.1 phytanoyl-CoA dioxygenase [Mycobacterium persicum]ORC07156.1 phytanoyl-CoA dioxygenase [Mycobacterium persicum]VAZ80328.1 hypothetical protein LAUMK15_05327 [Mycobacterium persicum]VBA30252.1 hypothetical protein LAUMK4_05027 [Mycobacterium persicum]